MKNRQNILLALVLLNTVISVTALFFAYRAHVDPPDGYVTEEYSNELKDWMLKENTNIRDWVKGRDDAIRSYVEKSAKDNHDFVVKENAENVEFMNKAIEKLYAN